MGHSCVRRSRTSFQEGTVNMIKCQCRIRGADLPGNVKCGNLRELDTGHVGTFKMVVRNVNDLTYQ